MAGTPQRPNPPTNKVWPDRTSFVASKALGYILELKAAYLMWKSDHLRLIEFENIINLNDIIIN